MNMSYCRFQNTVLDLADCMDALEEIDYDLTKLSADEEKAARRLIEICQEIAGFRANRLKSDTTPAELRLVLDYMEGRR